MGIEAIETYRQMPVEFIDEVVHICLLNACSHSGLIDDARTIFDNIENKTGKIYTTMVGSNMVRKTNFIVSTIRSTV